MNCLWLVLFLIVSLACEHRLCLIGQDTANNQQLLQALKVCLQFQNSVCINLFFIDLYHFLSRNINQQCSIDRFCRCHDGKRST